jgi:hypothetical protein
VNDRWLAALIGIIIGVFGSYVWQTRFRRIMRTLEEIRDLLRELVKGE